MGREKKMPQMAMAAAASFILFCLAGLGWAATRGIPLRGFDDIFFTPVILSAARSGVLANPYVALGETHAFVWHGWLYPTLMAWVPFAGSDRLIGAALLIVAALVTALFAFLMVRRAASGWERAAATVAMFAVALYQMGRPEAISSVLLCGALLIVPSRIVGRGFSIPFVIAMILTGLAQPTVTVLLCFAFAIRLAAEAPNWRVILTTLAVDGLCILGGVALLTELHPQMGFMRWIGGLSRQAGIVAGDAEGPIFVPYYLSNITLPLTVTYLLAVPVAGWLTWRQAADAPALPARRGAVVAGIVLFLVLVWYLMIRSGHPTYLLGLAPVLLLALVVAARARQRLIRLAAQGLLVVSALSASAATAYRTVQAVDSARCGLSVNDFAAGIAQLRGEQGRVGANGSVVYIVAGVLPGTRVVPWPRFDILRPPHPPADYDAPPELLVVKQADTGLAAPAPPSGYRVLIDRYRRETPRVLGLRYARTLKDYSYAVLCRDDACAEVGARLAQPALRGRAAAANNASVSLKGIGRPNR